jgi:hypothetical protein
MPTNIERLVATLERWPGLDDDQLGHQSGIQPRQQVNQICVGASKPPERFRVLADRTEKSSIRCGSDRLNMACAARGQLHS